MKKLDVRIPSSIFSEKNKCSAVAEMGERLATVNGGCMPLLGGAGSPSNTMWPGPKLATTDMGRKLGAVPLRRWSWVPN